MHTLLRAFLLTAIAFSLGAVNVNKPIPEIRLSDGRTLKNVEIMSYAPTAIMARWDGGRGTLKYDDLPQDVREAVESLRPQKVAPTAPKAPQTPTVITGQVFSITAGAGAYKYAGTTIYAYPLRDLKKAEEVQRNVFGAVYPKPKSSVGIQLEILGAWLEATKKLKPAAYANTDADGRYEIKLPAGDFFLFCTATRRTGGSAECSVWALPAYKDKLDLTTHNEWIQPE